MKKKSTKTTNKQKSIKKKAKITAFKSKKYFGHKHVLVLDFISARLSVEKEFLKYRCN